MTTEDILDTTAWKASSALFRKWLNDRDHLLQPGLVPEPTIKVLVFLALLESDKACSYEEIREIIKIKGIITGHVPDNTLRTSVLNLSKTLDKFGHPLELKSYRGRFQLLTRLTKPIVNLPTTPITPVILLLDPPAIKAHEVAHILMEKSTLPFHSLYFLEWSARWWENYSSKEAEIRRDYELGALGKLGIKERLAMGIKNDSVFCMVGLAPGEGLAEIELLKKLLRNEKKNTIHYLAIDSSPRLLRDHIGLLKETLTPEIEAGSLICGGVVADIFSGLREALERIKNEFKQHKIINLNEEFLPSSSSLLVTYFGNCLGNNFHDQETEIFSIIHSVFQNRPLEILVGVSVMRDTPDEYKINWGDFLLQTPRHLLDTKKFLKSLRPLGSNELPEFRVDEQESQNRCPAVMPEPYIVRHQIEGQIYRFYYKLSFDLELALNTVEKPFSLPKGTLILLYNIIKYNIQSLVNGIQKCGLFNIAYDKNYHQIVDTPNGKREYALFSAFLEK